MMTRRSALRGLVAGSVAMLMVVGSALAAELMGTIKEVKVDENTIVVTQKKAGNDVDVKVTDETIFVTAKGDEKKAVKHLEKLKKGMRVQVTHEDGVASKIVHKKGDPKKKKDAPTN